jgi:hypothetical protein
MGLAYDILLIRLLVISPSAYSASGYVEGRQAFVLEHDRPSMTDAEHPAFYPFGIIMASCGCPCVCVDRHEPHTRLVVHT